MNASPDAIAGLNELPVRTVNGATVYLRDVAQVRDGFNPQTNIVRRDGERGVLISIMKNSGASTLDIVATCARSCRARAPSCRPTSRCRRCSTSRCSSRRRSRAWCWKR
jgi:multidrug efflux pump subunit AcrB